MNKKISLLFTFALICLFCAVPRLAAAAPVRVSTVESFLQAIKPGADIIADINESNMTYALDYLRVSRPQWLISHPYLELADLGQGVEIVVHDVDGLAISGRKGGTPLSIEYRSSAVLSFKNCRNIKLRDLTLGHTPEQGDCSGDVLSFADCRNVTLERMDLFGCGYNGISVYGTAGCGKFLVKNSTIRGCSSGPLYIWLGDNESSPNRGTFIFDNCVMVGSDDGGSVRTDNIKLIFSNCKFGMKETYYYQQLPKNTAFKNCQWATDCDCAG